MSSERAETLNQLEAQQKRVAELTRELGELNLSVNATINELRGNESPTEGEDGFKREGARPRQARTDFNIGDWVEVTNSYKGK